jgi:hypothetical protein
MDSANDASMTCLPSLWMMALCGNRYVAGYRRGNHRRTANHPHDLQLRWGSADEPLADVIGKQRDTTKSISVASAMW